jgi:hypothetical protein
VNAIAATYPDATDKLQAFIDALASHMGEAYPLETYKSQYYLDHPDKRQQKLEECQNNPGEKALTPNCVNAGQAAHKAMFQGTEMPKLRFN